MSVTPEQIGGELVPPRFPTPAEAIQWGQWCQDVVLFIRLRCQALEVDFSTLDAEVVDLVVRRTVAKHAQRPDDAIQVSETTSIDDGSKTRSKSYRASTGELTVPADLWGLLGLEDVTDDATGAFSTTPGFEPDFPGDSNRSLWRDGDSVYFSSGWWSPWL